MEAHPGGSKAVMGTAGCSEKAVIEAALGIIAAHEAPESPPQRRAVEW